jgi:hypothetical protein
MLKRSKEHKTTLGEELQNLLKFANGKPLKLSIIISTLAGRGYAILLILFALPFCLPIQIPGVSTPFGLALSFLGLRVAFARSIWLPQWLLDKEIPYKTLEKVCGTATRIMDKFKRFLEPRHAKLVHHPLMYRINGLVIFLLGLFLALPLPVPMTNFFAASPIVVLGIAMLEDDFYTLIFGYILAGICFLAFGTLFWYGTLKLKQMGVVW